MHTMKQPSRPAVLMAAALAWVVFSAATARMPAVAGQEPPKTTTDKLKEKVGGAVQSIKKGAATAEQAIRDQFEKARAAISKMGTEARVYARLHWDKSLHKAKIDLSAPREGTIVLSGFVPDGTAKAKAVALTADTVGVDEVVDKLIVQTTESGGIPRPKP